MYTFLDNYIVTFKEAIKDDKSLYGETPKELFEFINSFGGYTFSNGLYRIHSFSSSLKWAILLGSYFPGYKNNIFPFAFDWMGRQFCMSNNGRTIFMFDPATLEDFIMEQSLNGFHDEELVNGILGQDLFKEIINQLSLIKIGYSECLGYRTPLFLGGADAIENYEAIDIEVYWHLQNELYQQVKNLPEGTKIGKINIKP
ncbi:MAG: DUF1851 domain-containing protein [Bacteroidetes bacterium]|nr:DUF1851 domain-containing protein [Bacteroidota bacterium]